MVKIINIGNGVKSPETPEQVEALKKALLFEANMILNQAQNGEWNPDEQTMTWRSGSLDSRYMGRNIGWYKNGTVFEDDEVSIQIESDLIRQL